MLRFPSVFIGFRYLIGHTGDGFSRFVSFMSTAGITIGVLSLVTVLSVMNGFEARLKSKILGVLPQAVITQEDNKTTREDTPPLFINDIEQVLNAEPIVRGEMVIQSANEISAGLMMGVDTDYGKPQSLYLLAGDFMALQAGSYQVLIGHSLARSLGVNVGDTVRLMVTSASQYTPLGRIPSQRNFTVAGVFNSGSDIDASMVVTNIEDAGRLLRYKPDTISGWRLYFDDPFIASDLADNYSLPQGWKWTDWREQRGELFQAVKMERNMMSMMLGLIVLIAAFNMISALVMVVMEKQSEVAILKTQGMTRPSIMAIFMIQGASSGVIGAIIGAGLGMLCANNINEIFDFLNVALLPGSLPVLIKPMQILTVLAITIGLSLLSTLYPSYSASSVKPAETLRYE